VETESSAPESIHGQSVTTGDSTLPASMERSRDFWWKCCACEREINKAIFGEERCPDCGTMKCGNCDDP
jgi:hypothetical protein